jgi:hypothetical protein
MLIGACYTPSANDILRHVIELEAKQYQSNDFIVTEQARSSATQ